MSKFGWSLPPGCTQRHIDEAYGSSADEALYDKIYDIVTSIRTDDDALAQAIFKLCGEVYGQAYKQGADDAHQAFDESQQ